VQAVIPKLLIATHDITEHPVFMVPALSEIPLLRDVGNAHPIDEVIDDAFKLFDY
jgi:hypothetical protein